MSHFWGFSSLYSIQKRAQVKMNHSTKNGTRTTWKTQPKRLWDHHCGNAVTRQHSREVFIEIRAWLKAELVLPDRGNKVSAPKPAVLLSAGRAKRDLAPQSVLFEYCRGVMMGASAEGCAPGSVPGTATPQGCSQHRGPVQVPWRCCSCCTPALLQRDHLHHRAWL